MREMKFKKVGMTIAQKNNQTTRVWMKARPISSQQSLHNTYITIGLYLKLTVTVRDIICRD